MKYAHVYALFLVFVFHTSCGQNQTNPPKDNTSMGYSESQLKEADTSKVPMGMVRHVKQARNGDILIASYLGVFRYDGTSFTNLTSKIISARFASFWDVLEDRRGNLWFASVGSGVYYYPSASLRAGGKSFQHFTTREGLANNSVGKIYEDKAGNIWFATGGGASRYDGKSFRNFTTKDGLPNNDINSIMEDKTGKLWFGTRGDACFYDGKTFTVLKNKDGKAFNNVWSIIEDKKGNIWFGDVDGLWRYDGRTFTKVSQRGAHAIIEDKKGNIWTTSQITTSQINPNGPVWALFRYDQKSLYNKNPTVTEIVSGGPANLYGILEANDGSIWFGGLGSFIGVHRYDGKTITDFRSKEDQK
jgi:ligand-binding sensor domain-containing protein